MNYYAKSDPPQSIEEHTKRVLAAYDAFRGRYPKLLDPKRWLMLRYACEYHDFGKHTAAFQRMIQEAMGLVYDGPAPQGEAFAHGFYSPCALPVEEMKQRGLSKEELAEVCAAICYHHERSNFPRNSLQLQDVIKKELTPIIKEKYGREAYCNYLKGVLMIRNDADLYGEEKIRPEFLRLLGLLNRFDYSASAGLAWSEMDAKDDSGRTVTERTREFFAKKGYLLNPVQRYLSENAGKTLAVIAATGSGKTEGALLWCGGEKTFYTLPVRTAINSMYLRIKSGPIGYQKTALLHSDALGVYLKESEEKRAAGQTAVDEDVFDQYTVARQFAAPLTVCTVDQLFKFVFWGKGCEARFATLSYSNVVIDEIQSYSPEIVACLIRGTELVKEAGGHVLIMTATLPKIIREQYLQKLLDERVKPPFHTALARRHRIFLREEHCLPVEEIAREAREKRVLVVRNTVKGAQELYDQLLEAGAAPKLLHSRFLRKDRAALEEEIRGFAPNDSARPKKTGVWVCTQIVEASLDVDFDILYTDLCAVESLLQRMGRVYRSRELDFEGCNVFVFDTRSGRGTVISQDIYDFSRNAVQAMNKELLIESDEEDRKQEMMDMVYDPRINPKIEDSEYLNGIKNRLDMLENLAYHKISEALIEKNFRNISSRTVMPQSIFEELERSGKIQEWRKALKTADKQEKYRIREEIASYTLSAPVDTAVCRSDFYRIYRHENFEITPCEYDARKGLTRISQKEYEAHDGSNVF